MQAAVNMSSKALQAISGLMPGPGLKTCHLYAHDLRLSVKSQAAVGFISVPQPQRLPYAAIVNALFGGHDFAADPG